MRPLSLCIFFMLTIPLGGCATVDGTNCYHLRGRLMNAQDGTPVAGAKIVGSAFTDYDPPREHWRHDFSITNANGEFDTPVHVLWGGLYPLFLIPEYRTPGALKEVAVYIGQDDKWQKKVVPLSKAQQLRTDKSDRWVDLGQILYDPNGPSITTRPAGQ